MFLVVITNFINDLEQYHLVGLIVMYTSILHWSFQLCSHIQPKSFDAGLTKWWNSELTVATNFGSHAQMVTKFGGEIWATKFGFVPDW